MAEIKEPIRIRRKKLTNGNVSLYLDIYLNGKREYEFLKLYLIGKHGKIDPVGTDEIDPVKTA